MSEGQRRLAAIMFTDIVGYTSLAQKDESSTLQALENHRRLLRPHFSSHGGHEIKTIGDAFLVEFQSALDALLCSMAIQQMMHDRKLATGDAISVRIGIHVGDVVERGNDILGDAVNIASRIEPLAEAGGVCISGEVYSQVRNKSDLPFISLGEKSLKNVNTPVTVYKAVMPWEKETVEPTPQLDPKRVAVLPFVSMSPDPNDEYFADGLTEELITRISLVRGLEVIARTSAMNYKKKEKNASQIGRELKVGTLLEGSVRKAGNRIRVSAQLINANTEGHLWAESYDRDLGDIFEVQASVAEKVAGSLQVKVLGREREALEGKGPAVTEAYVEYLRGLQFFHRLDDVWVRKAIRCFEKCLRLDPKYTAAAAQLSLCYFRLGYIGIEPGEKVYPRAKELASKALKLDENVAEGHLAMAVVKSNLDADWARADEEFRRSLELNPSLVDARVEYGRFLSNLGRFPEAIRETRKILELDPVSFLSELRVGGILMVVGRKAEGIAHLTKAVEMDPGSAIAHGILSDSLSYSGNVEDGLKESEKALRLRESPFILELRGRALARAGKTKEALQVVERIRRFSKHQRVAYGLAVVFAGLGRNQEAIDYLEEAYEEHALIFTPLFTVEEVFSELHGEPRFRALAHKVGLRVK